MKILISGGFGFIGSYMTNHFLKKGHHIGILSRNVPEYFKSLSCAVEVIHADVSRPIKYETQTQYDVFIHLAAANDIDSKNAKNALSITTFGTKNCLDFCYSNRIAKFIYFSTYQVYGTEEGYIDENSPLESKNDYGITHLFAEEYVRMYNRLGKIDYIILRPSNIFGGFLHKDIDRWSLVPNCFIKEVFHNNKITLLTSGKQQRDFISLEDVSKMTLFFCEKFDNISNNIYNLASGKSISIVTIAQKVKDVFDQKVRSDCQIIIKSQLPMTSVNFSISNRKIKKLGYRPSKEHDLDTEIGKIIDLLV